MMFPVEEDVEEDVVETEKYEQQDMTFDVSAIFDDFWTANSFNKDEEAEEIVGEDIKSANPEQPFDMTYDISGICGDFLKEASFDDTKEIGEIVDGDLFDVDHTEDVVEMDCIDTEEEDIGSVSDQSSEVSFTVHKYGMSYTKQLKTKAFLKENKIDISVVDYLCQENSTPYIASAAINEEIRWSEERPVIQSMNWDEIKQFYNVPNVSESPKSMRPKRRKVQEDANLSVAARRVLMNEVIEGSEGQHQVTFNDVKQIVNESENFIQSIFSSLSRDTNPKSSKKPIKRLDAQTACSRLFSNNKDKEEFLGELIQQKPRWTSSGQRHTNYRNFSALKTQLGSLGKKYPRPKLVKDLRL